MVRSRLAFPKPARMASEEMFTNSSAWEPRRCAPIHAALEKFGRSDVVVNNAGPMAFAPLAKTVVDEWDRMIDINFKGRALRNCRRASGLRAAEERALRQHGLGGRPEGQPGWRRHQARRARDLRGPAQEAGEGIRTTIISPGAVQSELLLGSSDPESAARVKELYRQQ